MKLSLCLLVAVCAEKMTTEVAESSNMHYITNRHARNEACKAPGKCLNPYCSLYDCYERNNKPLCAGEIKNVVNTPTEAKVGIHHNIKETVVKGKGWSTRLHERYGAHHGRDMRNVISNWNTQNMWMFIAAQLKADRGNDYYIGAFAPTRRVFSRCNNSRHCGYRTLPASDCVHGAYWYCVVNWSFGYTAQHQVRLCSADTFGVWGGNAAAHGNHRLSWHMHYWYTAGWRAGWVHNMNSESGVYKLVLTKTCNGCGKPAIVVPKRPVCKVTTCVEKRIGRELFTNVYATKNSGERWECKAYGTACKCFCEKKNKCTLHSNGYTNHHC